MTNISHDLDVPIEYIEDYEEVNCGNSGDIPPVEMEVIMSGDGEVEEEYLQQYDVEYEYDGNVIVSDDYYENEEEFEFEEVITEPPLVMDWRDQQKMMLDLYEIMDSLPSSALEEYAKLCEYYGVNIDLQRYRREHCLAEYHEVDDDEEEYSLQPKMDSSKINYEDNNFEGGSQKEGAVVHEYYDGRQDDTQDLSEEDFRKSNGGENRKCPGCNMYLRRSVFYHHARMMREKGACNLFTPQRFPCPQCDFKLGTLEKLCHHLEQIHDAPTTIKTVVFETEDEFNLFRLDLEGKGGNFRMARGNKKNKKGIVQYFRCNRTQTIAKNDTFRLVDIPSDDENQNNDSGTKKKRKKRKDLFPRKLGGSKTVIRTENVCTAFYNKAYLPNGQIEVRYCDHHLHGDEKLRLPVQVRQRVLNLSKKKLPHVVILMIIKDERPTFVDKNSANERRVMDMTIQDVRQIIAGVSRSGKGRAELEASLIEENESGEYIEVLDEGMPKAARNSLSPYEAKYVDLYERNKDLILNRLNVKAKKDADKRNLFDLYLRKMSATQELVQGWKANKYETTDSITNKIRKLMDTVLSLKSQYMNPQRNDKEPEERPEPTFLRLMEMGAEWYSKDDDSNEIDVVGYDDDPEFKESQERLKKKMNATKEVSTEVLVKADNMKKDGSDASTSKKEDELDKLDKLKPPSRRASKYVQFTAIEEGTMLMECEDGKVKDTGLMREDAPYSDRPKTVTFLGTDDEDMMHHVRVTNVYDEDILRKDSNGKRIKNAEEDLKIMAPKSKRRKEQYNGPEEKQEIKKVPVYASSERLNNLRPIENYDEYTENQHVQIVEGEEVVGHEQIVDHEQIIEHDETIENEQIVQDQPTDHEHILEHDQLVDHEQIVEQDQLIEQGQLVQNEQIVEHVENEHIIVHGQSIENEQMVEHDQTVSNEQIVDHDEFFDHNQIVENEQTVSNEQIIEHDEFVDPNQIVEHEPDNVRISAEPNQMVEMEQVVGFDDQEFYEENVVEVVESMESGLNDSRKERLHGDESFDGN